MKRTHSHIPLLIFAISVMLVVAALYVYMFQATSVSVARAGLARDIVISEQNDQVQYKVLLDALVSTANDRAKLATFFVSSDDTVSFITALEALGPQSGSSVTITSIDTDIPVNAPAGTVGRVQAHIDAQGSWESVMRLLGLAERMPYAVTVSHVRLGAGETTKSQRLWDMSFDVQVLSRVNI